MSTTGVGILSRSLFFEFVRCQRGDGTFYGTGGQCRKGREVDPKKIIEKLVQGLSPTKGEVFQSALNPKGGLIGKGKDLGNGVSVVKGDSTVLERLGKVFGLPRPVAKVDGSKNEVIVARKTIQPWLNLKAPPEAMTPFRKDNPMAAYLDRNGMFDIDFAVNPTLLDGRWLLQSTFDRYNKEFFGGKLPETGLFIAPSASMFTGAAISITRKKDGPNIIALSLKLLKTATEESIHGTLLHEMVHIHDYTKGRFREGHGRRFTSKLKEIDKAWKRDTNDVFVDQLVFQPRHMSIAQKREMSERQFPQIKATKEFLAKAVFDGKYRLMGWK